MFMLSCSNIVVYKTEFSDDYIINEGQHFEMFYYPGKDSYAKPEEFSQYEEEFEKEFEKEYFLNNNNVDVLIEKGQLVYKFINGSVDTLSLETGKYFNKNYILPFNFNLDNGMVSNQMYVKNVDSKLKWIVTYKGDSIHYFNNQKPIKTYIFNYYPFRADYKFENYSEPITYHISSVDGMVVAVDYSRRDDFFSQIKDSTSTLQLIEMQDRIVDYRVFHCKKKKLKKYLM
jgi:hypothetical protein